MEKYFNLGYLFVGIGFIGILIIFRSLIKIIKNQQKMILEVALNHNMASYHFARFIVNQMQDKAQQRPLTEEEQDFWHHARKVVYAFEQQHKAAFTQQS